MLYKLIIIGALVSVASAKVKLFFGWANNGHYTGDKEDGKSYSRQDFPEIERYGDNVEDVTFLVNMWQGDHGEVNHQTTCYVNGTFDKPDQDAYFSFTRWGDDGNFLHPCGFVNGVNLVCKNLEASCLNGS